MEKLFRAIGREELITDEKFVNNAARIKNNKELDAIIGGWIGERELSEVITTLTGSGAVVGPMYDVSQVFDDPHYLYRESFVTLPDNDFEQIRIPNVVAKFSRTPGQVRSPGPAKGQHNQEIYGKTLGLSELELAELKDKKII